MNFQKLDEAKNEYRPFRIVHGAFAAANTLFIDQCLLECMIPHKTLSKWFNFWCIFRIFALPSFANSIHDENCAHNTRLDLSTEIDRLFFACTNSMQFGIEFLISYPLIILQPFRWLKCCEWSLLAAFIFKVLGYFKKNSYDFSFCNVMQSL